MTVHFKLVERDGKSNITLFVNGSTHNFDDSHPNWDSIKEKAIANDESVADLFDVGARIVERFQALTERVAMRGSTLLFDGVPVDDVIAEHIVSYVEEDDDRWISLANFLEKVYSNTNEEVRENLYRWLSSTGGFTITSTGNIIGYKGVRNDFTSWHAGPGVVDGVEMNDHLPNKPGSTLSIARDYVDSNPNNYCSTGLHVGSWAYGSTFAQITLAVEFNPAHVVSVPTDHNGQKARVFMYKVLKQVDEPYKERVVFL